MRRKEKSLKNRMMFLLFACMVPMVLVISVLFWQTLDSNQRSYMDTLMYMVEEIENAVDEYASGAYSISDRFSNDGDLLDLLAKDYSYNPMGKKSAIVYANNALFESYNRLQLRKKIDAIYVVKEEELFDFLDPNQDCDAVIEQIRNMNMNDEENLGKFCWYPLQDNFLTTSTYGEVRKDHVVFGSRRIYSVLKSGYPYLHIFAIQEQVLHEMYAQRAEHMGASVYLFNEDGGLISSTDEDMVAACEMPVELLELKQGMEKDAGTGIYQQKHYNIAKSESDVTGWTTMVMVSTKALMMDTVSLYVKILAVILVCVGLFVALLFIWYRQFMKPIASLESSMRKVEEGDLQAYVEPQGQEELAHMMSTYNAMLDKFHAHVVEQVEMEKTKQDMEMQVLVSQINPHFLYNTLETIVWKAGRSDIGKLAASLGKLYRLSISGGLFVPLQRELEHVQMYMNIQESRYSKRVRYEVSVEGCDPNEVQTLKLILQPVVENSLLYGMEGLEREMVIRLEVSVRESLLILKVKDNGTGMEETALKRLKDQIVNGRRPENGQKNHRSTGIGLHNIYGRLKLYAGEKTDVQVSSTPGEGTEVVLIQPYQKWSKEEPDA